MPVVFTSVGEAKTADLFDGTVAAPANWHVGWGTGATAPAKGDTGLQTPSAEARVAATESQPLADKNRLVALITSAGAQTITEAAVFDASTGGNMVVRGTFTGIVLASGDKIEFTIEIEWT